jgi:hypothetical protein
MSGVDYRHRAGSSILPRIPHPTSRIPHHPPVFRLPSSPMADSSTRVQITKAGVTFGSALAITISWSTHHSILWACIHGVFSWLYVIYFALTR